MTAQRSETSTGTPLPDTSTTLWDGTVIPLFAYDNGRSVVGAGHIEDEAFLRDARTLFELYDVDHEGLDAECIIRRHALFRQEADGSQTIMWNLEETWERVTEATPGAVPVTLTEV